MNRLTELRRKIQALKDEPAKAIPWMQEAARLGDYNSIRTLVYAYTHGDYGLPLDETKAYEYTVMGARLGEGWCLYNAAVSARQGQGTPVDMVQSRKWMLAAAEAGQLEAYLPAAEMLVLGQGGPVDLHEAKRLCQKAVDDPDCRDRESARELLGNIYNEEGINYLRAGNHIMAAGSFRQGVDLDNTDCVVNLAYEYTIEDGVGPDEKETFDLCLKAADAGHPLGMYNVSMCYREGHGTEKDLRTAFEWMRNAAKSGFAEAYLPLAQHYYYGVGVHQDKMRGLQWASEAARTDCRAQDEAKAFLAQIQHDPAVRAQQ